MGLLPLLQHCVRSADTKRFQVERVRFQGTSWDLQWNFYRFDNSLLTYQDLSQGMFVTGMLASGFSCP